MTLHPYHKSTFLYPTPFYEEKTCSYHHLCGIKKKKQSIIKLFNAQLHINKVLYYHLKKERRAYRVTIQLPLIIIEINIMFYCSVMYSTRSLPYDKKMFMPHSTAQFVSRICGSPILQHPFAKRKYRT